MRRKTAREIDIEAGFWAGRIDRGPLSPAQELEFQAWLSDDVRKLGAYGRVRALALITERAQALGPGFDPTTFAPPASSSRRAVVQWGGAAAAVALVGVVGWEGFHRTTRYQTTKGEMKVVALKDGSAVTLNTDSDIAVRFSDRQRSVQLIRGEALFDVAKNRDYPFVVAAGDTQVRVIGTSFTVRRLDPAPVLILVREGVVEVSKTNSGGARPIRISANTTAVVAFDRAEIDAHSIAPAQLSRELAWQEGKISFEGETLDQAAAEFARYSDTRVVIADPGLAHEEIAGLFKADDPIGFARTIAISLNAKATISDGQVLLTR